VSSHLATTLTELRLEGLVTIDPLDNRLCINGKELAHHLYEQLGSTDWLVAEDSRTLSLGNCTVSIRREQAP
jgi:hypothetical protein